MTASPELRRAQSVLAVMEDTLAVARPGTPPILLAYWTERRDQAALDVALLDPGTHLVVVRPFGALSRGDTVREPLAMAALLAGPNGGDVLRVVSVADALGDGWFGEGAQ